MRKIFLAVVLTALSGCKLDLLSLASVSPVGHYSLDMTRTEESIKSTTLAEAQKTPGSPEDVQRRAEEQQKKALAILSAITVTMTLNQDGTWESVFGWGGFQTTAKGTWEQKDDKLMLTTLQEDGRQQTKPKIDEAVYKGNEIYLTNKSSDLNNAFVLTRSAT